MPPITRPSRRLLIAVVAGAALATGIVQAQARAPAPASTASAATATPQLTIRDIYDRMEAAGYRDMREIEFSKGRYEVKGRNAQGKRVKLEVNASTGAVERTRGGD